MAESSRRALIGVTAHAQDQLGEVSSLELPPVGTRIRGGEAFGVIESLKAASDLFAPVSGEVVDVNLDLETAPERVNDDPYGTWLVAIVPDNPSDADALLSAAEYDELVA